MKSKNLALLTLTLALAACSGAGGGGYSGGGSIGGGGGGGGGGGDPTPPPTTSDGQTFVDNLNYDDYLETYFLAKDPSEKYGTIIVQEGNGSYWGIDIKDSTRWTYTYDLDYYLDDSFQVFYQYGNTYQDSYGNYYEKTTEVSKDLAKVSAVLSKVRAKSIGEQLAANYGLSEERGIELGTKLVEYKDAKKTRAFTKADEDRFAVDIAGSSISDMAKANEKYQSGDTADMDSLIQTAAAKNGTTPEHIKELFDSILTK